MAIVEALSAELPLPPRYQLRSILKQTAATSVYRVFDASDRHEKAIKILRHELSETQQLLRFKSEFTTLASLDHPSIVRVCEFGLLRERLPYFTMEFFEGQKISDWFDGSNWDALHDVLIQIASALHHIHRLGIVHLDLKPSNILVDDAGKAKIMDFGVAIESRQIFDRQIRGTLHYMSPEVLRQDRVDARADLYALGMTIYETVTGALPGYGKPALDVIRMHLDESIRPASSINPGVPEELDRIIAKLLETDPRHRYSSSAALLQALAEAAGTTVPTAELLLGNGELFAAPLINREDEVAQLSRLIEDAREGRGGGVLIAGAEGVGKSRIVRDVTLRAQLDGARVFCGRCPINRKTIYAPFFDIFQQMVLAVNPEANVTEEVRRLMRTPIRDEVPTLGRKYRLFNRFVQSLQDLYGFLNASSDTTGAPLIIVVEDVQWADRSTSELFSFLVGEAKQNRLMVVGTLTGSDPAWIQRAQEGSFPVVNVGPLDEPLVRELVQALLGEQTVSDEFVRWVFWESAGSPMNVRRVLDYLVTHRFLHWQASGWVADVERIRTLRIPGGAASILMEKVDALSCEERGLLQAAAVFGEVAEIELLTDVSSSTPDETYESIQSIVRQGIVDESPDGKTVSFPQIHLRDAVYGAMPDTRRAELHLRAGNALEPRLQTGSTHLLGQIAFHFARANDIDRGIRYSIEAGELASRSAAHQDATDFYRLALELMDLAAIDDERKSDAREKLADAYYRSSDYRSAMQSYQFLLKSIQARSQPGPNPDLARVTKKIGKVLSKRGEHEPALAYFQAAMTEYERLGQTLEVAELLNRIAGLFREQDDLVMARDYAERALRLLNPAQPTVVYGYVKNMLGVLEYATGNWQKSREPFLEALTVSEKVASEQLCKVASTNLGNTLWKLGDWKSALQYYKINLNLSETEGDLWDLVTAYNNVGVIEFCRGDFKDAAQYFEKSIRIDEKIGAVESEALARQNLGEAYELLGRWPEASDQYQRCLGLQGFDDGRASRSSVYVPLARLTNKRGNIPKAVEYAHKALAAAERARDEDLVAEACYTLAAIEDERENFADGERYLNRALRIFEAHHTMQGLARAHTASASIAFSQHRIDDAIRHAELGANFARQLDDRFNQAKNDWMWGKIHSLQGNRDAAAAKFSEARAIFEELETPYESARLQFDVGLLREEPEEAAQMIRVAIRTFERLEATNDLERARGALFRIKPTAKAPDSAVVGLYEVVKIINSTLNLEDVLGRVLDVAIRRLRAERGMILLLDPITGQLRTRVVRNISETDPVSRRSPQSIVKEVMQSGVSVISADARADQRFTESESVIAENILSILCVPLIIKERIAGAIYVDHREARHVFSEKDRTFLEAFADQAAIAIENARLYEELEEARARLSLENESLRREVLVEKHLDSVVGGSDAVSKIQFAIRKAAAGNSTVLLRGESGTGKGLVARIIHNVSPRRNGPFIKFNCAALPETLAESELFGHEKGSFTGADRRKLGRFELANGGTIFLDEIGKVSLAMQAKLLRVVEEKEFERVGGTQTIKSDVKIITATNLDLERAIEEGSFREDLFYRLNIVPLVLPPLRDRKEDIPVLAEHFLRKICLDLGVETKRLEPGVLELFFRYHWPGNVRELEATLHRAIVMSNGAMITRNDFFGLFEPASNDKALAVRPIVSHLEVTGDVYDEVLSSVDKQLIQRALHLSNGRIREAARRLGLARNTLKAKMQKYSITARE